MTETVEGSAGFDYSRATMDEVIARSVELHPFALCAALRSAALDYEGYAKIAHERRVSGARVADRMAAECRKIANAIESCRWWEWGLTLSETIQAFHVACKLQAVPRDVRQAIAGRG